MNDFKKNNRFGDKRGGGFNKGGFGGGFGKRPLEMFSATCASCGKVCEVPFKPNGKKPVYCKECFAENGGPEPRERSNDRNDRFVPRRDFDRPRPAFKPEFRSDSGAGLGELKRTIESMNSKLDKLVSLMSVEAAKPALKEVVAPYVASEAPAKEKKSTAKKATKKKK